MKVLVVLVLAVFTGCIASPVVAKPKQDKVFGLLVDLLLTHIKAADSIYWNFWRTEFGKAVIKHFEEPVNTAGRTLDGVMRNLPDSTKEIIEKSLSTNRRLLSQATQYILKNHLEPLAESAAPVIEEVVGALVMNGQPIQDAASPYINVLMEMVDSSLQDFQERLKASHLSLSQTE